MISFIDVKDTQYLNTVFVDNDMLLSEPEISKLRKIINVTTHAGIIFSLEDYNKLLSLPNLENFIGQFSMLNACGEPFFDSFLKGEEPNRKELLKVYIQYFCDYNLGFGSEIFDRDIKVKLDNYKEKLTKYTVKDISELKNILEDSFNSDGNPSDNIKNIVAELCKNNPTILPEKCKNKELLKVLLDSLTLKELEKYIDNISKLRTCCEIWLDNTTYLKTSQKRFIMKKIEGFEESQIVNEFRPNKTFWKTIYRAVRPETKKFKNYVKARLIFNQLMVNKLTFSTQGNINKMVECGFISEAMESLISKKMNGILIRQIINMCLKANETQFSEAIKLFDNNDFKIKHLIELKRAIKLRLDFRERVVKTQTNKFKTLNVKLLNQEEMRKLKVLDHRVSVKILTQLPTKFNFKSIDKSLRKINVPISTKDTPIFDKYLTRGSRIKVNGTKFRVFTGWKKQNNKHGQYDLDLSAISLDDNGKHINTVNWQSRYVKIGGIIHSGDYTHCREFDPNNPLITAEFIDVYVNQIPDDVRYIAFTTIGYNCSFMHLDAFAGVQDISINEDDYINLNDSHFKMQLQGDYNNNIMFVFDKETNELIIIGEPMNVGMYSVIGKKAQSIYATILKYGDINVSMYDLISYMNIEGEEIMDNNFLIKNAHEFERLINEA